MNFTKINRTEKFKKQYKKLPFLIKKKFLKQLEFLLKDMSYPSLQVKKMPGSNIFEARVDYHHRFRFITVDSALWLLTIGPHDEGLGKP